MYYKYNFNFDEEDTMSELTQEQLKTFVMRFYAKVQQDELLGVVFNEIAQVDWDNHIPLLCKFWNSIMLGTKEYRGNAYYKHVELSKKTLITHSHFDRWLRLFEETAIANLSLQDAQTIVERATMIAKSLKHGMQIQ